MKLGVLRVLAYALGVAGLSNCLNPTEIILELSTNIACTNGDDHGVAVAVGLPGDDSVGVSAVGKSCTSDGGLGTVVVLPHSGIDEIVAIRVTLGVDAAADQCRAPDFAGCVVARRSLRFDPHTPLTLPIDLDQSCIGVPCTPDSTCIAGACVDAGVTCDGGSCVIESDASPPPPPGGCIGTQGAVLVQSNLVANSPTRLVRTSAGWAVLYQTSATGALAADTIVEGSTGILTIGPPIQLTPSSTSVGAFGTTNNSFAVTFGKGADTGGAFIGFDAGGVGWTAATTVPGVSGLFLLDDAGTVVTPAINNATQQQQPVVVTVVAGGGPTLHPPFTVPSGASNIALAPNLTSATDFYATFNDGVGNCYANACSWAPSVFSCAPNIDVVQKCDRIRGAARGTEHAIATIAHGQDTVFVDASYVLGIVDSFSTLAILATKSDYVILTGVAGALSAARYDGVTQPTSSALPTGITGITSLDAVADDATSSGYAVALVSGTSLFFMHVCK